MKKNDIQINSFGTSEHLYAIKYTIYIVIIKFNSM